MIQIISDSGTLYSQIDAKNKGLYVIPLNIIVDHKSYRDYDTISSTELLKMIDEKKVPSTSLPSVGERIDLYNSLTNQGDTVIDITIASGLSGAYQSAVLAKEECEHPEMVYVVNSQTLAGPMRAMVDQAYTMAKEGKSVDSILAMLSSSIQTEVSFLIPQDFSFLKRGGRVSSFEAVLGGILKLLPVMIRRKKKVSDESHLENFTLARTMKKAYTKMAEYMKEKGVGEGYYIFISHANNIDDALKAESYFKQRFPQSKIVVMPLSPAFITQGGPKCLAVQAIKIVQE
ncbi:DegV family protein [Dubosiella newyorkensis]|uniref:DegV family protein n=1 Tax=Dubosiella newyorkensis TaxID=1862672 RepID=UPI00258F7874|nr:DegV family protein [Dubosiella newyorkensis]